MDLVLQSGEAGDGSEGWLKRELDEGQEKVQGLLGLIDT
jgi:hypothetical protein